MPNQPATKKEFAALQKQDDLRKWFLDEKNSVNDQLDQLRENINGHAESIDKLQDKVF